MKSIITNYYYQVQKTHSFRRYAGNCLSGYKPWTIKIERTGFKKIKIAQTRFLIIGYENVNFGYITENGNGRRKTVKCIVININQYTQNDIEFGYLYCCRFKNNLK